jgi:hypothetical protein
MVLQVVPDPRVSRVVKVFLVAMVPRVNLVRTV